MAGGLLRVTFVLSRPSGYMAACWRALQATEGVEVTAVVGRPTDSGNAPFDGEVLRGLAHRYLKDCDDESEVLAAVAAQPADVLVLGGWQHQGIAALAGRRDHLGADTVIMAMDNPQRFTGHGLLLSARHRSYLGHVDAVWVPGERSRALAAELRTRGGQVFTGLYGVDDAFARPAPATGEAGESWPRSFLFVGQYVARKGLDVLLEAYEAYRGVVDDPWGLSCAGTGHLAGAVRRSPGVTDRGFVQPRDHPSLVASHGALVVSSRVDPWPLVVVEGALAGLPIVATTACGSAVEVLRDGWNGRVVPVDDAPALTAAMVELHRHADRLPVWGARSAALAQPFGAGAWAERTLVMLARLGHPVERTP